MKLFYAMLLLATPAAALAANDVALKSTVLQEKTVQVQGQARTVLEAPKLVTPGDKLVFVLEYRNQGAKPAADFVVTNPLPSAVAFERAESPGAVVSADGGKSFGELARLTVANPDGTRRPATATDVTHIRWTLQTAIPAGQGGKLSFRGRVR
ncbi:MAG TPA: hypothetical protein VF636_06000 [Sphingomonas sp.]|jgi:uncharacterized repeat protein (TIGR01451 family)